MVETQLLITKFRNAIDKAKENGEFDDDFMFKHFPRGCCGDAAYLLGEFLAEHGILFAVGLNAWT